MTKPQRPATRQQAADHAGVSIWTINRWVKTGRLTVWRTEVPGGPGRPSVLLDLAEVDRITTPVASK